MTLTKNKMIHEIGRRTRLKNRDVQLMLEALVEVWIEELVSGGRIEMENFMVLETRRIDRGSNAGKLSSSGKIYDAPKSIHRLVVRASKRFRSHLADIQ